MTATPNIDPDTAQFLAWLKDRLAAAEARGYQRGADEIDALLEERDRLRGALERLMLSRDVSWTGGHDWEEALDEAAALLEEVGNE